MAQMLVTDRPHPEALPGEAPGLSDVNCGPLGPGPGTAAFWDWRGSARKGWAASSLWFSLGLLPSPPLPCWTVSLLTVPLGPSRPKSRHARVKPEEPSGLNLPERRRNTARLQAGAREPGPGWAADAEPGGRRALGRGRGWLGRVGPETEAETARQDRELPLTPEALGYPEGCAFPSGGVESAHGVRTVSGWLGRGRWGGWVGYLGGHWAPGRALGTGLPVSPRPAVVPRSPSPGSRLLGLHPQGPLPGRSTVPQASGPDASAGDSSGSSATPALCTNTLSRAGSFPRESFAPHLGVHRRVDGVPTAPAGRSGPASPVGEGHRALQMFGVKSFWDQKERRS